MLSSLQILRGIAAWMVVFHHIVQSYFMGERYNFFWVFVDKYGLLGVDIFFILSGFVMGLVSKKYEKRGNFFLINRIYRVVPPYWFYTVLLAISIIALPEGTYLTWWKDLSLLKSFFLIPNINPNGYGFFPTLYVGWTLIYELFFYIVFSSILLMGIPKPAITCSFTLFIVALLFREYNFLGHSSLLLLDFSMGLSFFILYNEGGGINKVKVSFLSFIMLIIFVSFLLNQSLANRLLISAFVVIAFISLESILSLNHSLLVFLKKIGDYSYSTYLNHIIIIGWYYWILGVFNLRDSDSIAVSCIVFSVYIISKYSYQYLENNFYIAQNKHFLTRMLTKKTGCPIL